MDRSPLWAIQCSLIPLTFWIGFASLAMTAPSAVLKRMDDLGLVRFARNDGPSVIARPKAVAYDSTRAKARSGSRSPCGAIQL